MPTALVENTIYAAGPGRDPVPFSVKIWIPTPHPAGGDFTCRVEMTHRAQPIEIGGVDPLQSLVLAIAFLNIEFRSLLAAGWLFYLDQDDDEPFDPSTTYFPPSHREPAT